MSKHQIVRFNDDEEVHEVPHVEDLSIDERLCLWYTNLDYQDMRVLDKMIIGDMERGVVPGGACIRGLESRTSSASMDRKTIILDSVCAGPEVLIPCEYGDLA